MKQKTTKRKELDLDQLEKLEIELLEKATLHKAIVTQNHLIDTHKEITNLREQLRKITEERDNLQEQLTKITQERDKLLSISNKPTPDKKTGKYIYTIEYTTNGDYSRYLVNIEANNDEEAMKKFKATYPKCTFLRFTDTHYSNNSLISSKPSSILGKETGKYLYTIEYTTTKYGGESTHYVDIVADSLHEAQNVFREAFPANTYRRFTNQQFVVGGEIP